LKRAIQRLIQDPLAMKILDGKILSGDRVAVVAPSPLVRGDSPRRGATLLSLDVMGLVMKNP
jgi:ATP-dependent Clp protease ATP-binding subunit ClpA